MERLTRAQKYWLGIFILIATSSIIVRALTNYKFDDTALLYVGLPSLVSLALIFTRKDYKEKKWWHGYITLSRDSLIVLLGTSLVLFEGFICVLFFIPIYFAIVLLVWLIHFIVRKVTNNDKSKLNSIVLPSVLMLLSLEGVHPSLEAPRQNRVSATKVVSLAQKDVIERLNSPIKIQQPNDWMLQVFPAPHTIENTGLKEGEVHQIHYRYKRWFFTNIHDGAIKLKIEEVEPNRIKTKILENTSYLSNYLKLEGTEILLTPLSNNKTEIKLSVSYSRTLDPSWYFDPMQKYAVEQMAQHLISEIME